MARRPRSRGSRAFDKPPLKLRQLLARLQERGLAVADPARTERYLRHIGYYRLSPYTIPFQQGGPDHQFRAGTDFDAVLDLYVFDRTLRLLVLDALERVEVAVRAALTDHMSTAYEDSHWYVDPSHFEHRQTHTDLLTVVRRTCRSQLSGLPDDESDALVHKSALEHYLTTYGSPELPPSWLMGETLTIGQLAKTYGNLKRRADRTAIAESVRLTEPVLRSWLKTYVRVRNISAHHGRLWNVGLGVYPVIPRSSSISWLEGAGSLPDASKKRLYPVLVSLQSVLGVVSPHSSWARRLHDLVHSRPPMNLAGMGFPSDWASDEFWARRIG